MMEVPKPRKPTAVELAYHLGGLALLGEIAPLVVIPRMPSGYSRDVVSAVVAVYKLHKLWPVDLGLVADVLHEREQWWPMGGVHYLIPMMEKCRERMDRARELGRLLAIAMIAKKHLDAVSATDDALLGLIDQRAEETDKADAALALLGHLSAPAANDESRHDGTRVA